jgi:hypothetical protein
MILTLLMLNNNLKTNKNKNKYIQMIKSMKLKRMIRNKNNIKNKLINNIHKQKINNKS